MKRAFETDAQGHQETVSMTQHATSRRGRWRTRVRQRRWSGKSSSYLSVVAFLCAMLVLFVSACSLPWASPTVEQGTPVVSPVVGNIPVTGTASPTQQASHVAVINYQAIGCPSSVASIKWDT